MWSKDLGRTIDYLQTRDDMQADKIAYYGLSWGSAMAPMMLGAEPRIKAAVLVVAGLLFQRAYPEAEPINFLPHITIPVLICNGKYDFFFPHETSQVPLYELLGTPEEDKRLIVKEGAHDFPRTELARESLAWLDRYLGEVE
jgi:dienelactone hydrolase